MVKAVFIDRKSELAPELNYRKFRAEYVAMLERMTGSNWTDYNAHDPGITILEHLCYGLTELGYKTNYPITDLLEETQAGSPVLSDSFYPAYRIMVSSPVTINDYRKVILDRFNERIKNVWLAPVESFANRSIGGFYNVIVQPEDALHGDPAKLDKLRKEMALFLAQRRNLCEEFNEIIITTPLNMWLEGKIDIEPDADADRILATILYQVDQILAPDVGFQSLFKMQQDGHCLEQIFEGPLLENGFILDEDLQLPPREIYVSQLLRSVLGIEGVKSIHNLRIVTNARAADTYIRFEEHTRPVLQLNIKDASKPLLKIFKSGVQATHQSSAVIREIEYLNARKRRVFRLDYTQEETLNPKRGNNRHVQEYSSIQNDFPLVYGIGKFGLPPSATDERKAQALQLKSYLLLFEQVMANYLAQLANSNRLFSFTGKTDSTYYTQPVADIHGVEKLLRRAPVAREDENGEIVVENGFDDVMDQYRAGLHGIVAGFEDVFERKNRALDHLLARFGEYFNNTLLQKLGHYFSPAGVQTLTLIIKSEFLKSICELTAGRGRGFDYNVLSVEKKNDNISIFEKRMRLLLGILDSNALSVFTLLRKYQIELDEADGDAAYFTVDENGSERLQSLKYALNESDDFVYFEETGGKKPELAILDGRPLDSAFFVNGVHPQHYFVRASRYDGNEGHYDLLFRSPETGKYMHIDTFPTWERSVAHTRELVSFFKSLQLGTESLRVVEHNLLLPPMRNEVFNFELRDSQNRVLLTAANDLPYEDAAALVGMINAISTGAQPGSFAVSGSAQQGFTIKLLVGEEELQEPRMLHPYHYKTAGEAQEQLTIITRLIDEFVNDQHDPYRFMVKVGEVKMNINFFSCQATVVLPALSARFNDPEFRRTAEQVMVENMPAHIYVNFLWPGMADYEAFEKLRARWQEVKAFQEISNQHYSSSSAALAAWLHKHHN